MAYVITSPCIGVKDASCVEECPVDCIHEGEDQYYIDPDTVTPLAPSPSLPEDQYYIDPDTCIDCGACEPVCPVEAIYAEEFVPEEEQEFIQKNADFFA